MNDRSTPLISMLLSAPDRERGAAVLISEEAAASFSCPSGQIVAESEVIAVAASATPPAVLGVERLSPRLLRALRRQPPRLLVVTGDIAVDTLDAFARAGTRVLGPAATLRIQDAAEGDTESLLACATSTSELAALVRVLGAASVRVALAPTPGWLVEWLRDPSTNVVPVGYVAALELAASCAPGDPEAPRWGVAWARWFRDASRAALSADGRQPVIVPLGLESPPIDAPMEPELAAAVAGHTFERLTGPLFPAPTVLRTVCLHGQAPSRNQEPPAGALELWSQARRAVPLLGTTLGMDRPLPGLPLTVPTAAFLAQRALLRRAHARDIVMATHRARAADDDDDATGARSLEVLRGAGQALSEHESKVVLRGFGIEITRQAVASSASGAAHFAEKIGFPVVLKAVSPDLRRKQDVGGVVLDRSTAASVRRAYATIVHNVEQRAPTARLDGVLVAEQIGAGLEIECGALRIDDDAVALYGRAVGVPVAQEFVFALAGLDPTDALLLAHAILSQVPVPALRRRADPRPEDLAELFVRLDALVCDARCGPRLLAVELSPIRLVGPPRGYVTLDARILQRAHLDGL